MLVRWLAHHQVPIVHAEGNILNAIQLSNNEDRHVQLILKGTQALRSNICTWGIWQIVLQRAVKPDNKDNSLVYYFLEY